MTRMWMVRPDLLCDRHLLGEHKELHQLVGCINKGRMNVIRGHARQHQVDTTLIVHRHEQLVEEMSNRGFNHKSPLPDFEDPKIGVVSVSDNVEDLQRRCVECFLRIDNFCRKGAYSE